MKLSTLKEILTEVESIQFYKSDGSKVPAHFHLTEIGKVQKDFIDCGGTFRSETVVSLQLWEGIDIWHRLEPSKFLKIIEMSENKLGIQDDEIEVEYQADTIGKYYLNFENGKFILESKKTACLASESCGIPSFDTIKQKVSNCCTPGGGCC